MVLMNTLLSLITLKTVLCLVYLKLDDLSKIQNTITLLGIVLYFNYCINLELCFYLIKYKKIHLNSL